MAAGTRRAGRATASAGEDDREQARVLVRLPVGPGAWAEALPPAPHGTRITVSLSSGALMHEHGEALDLLGYVVIDAPEDPEGTAVAWLVVEATVPPAHPRWWGSVRSMSDGVFSTAMGPVLRRYAALLSAHTGAGHAGAGE